jgi:hypothetical protein
VSILEAAGRSLAARDGIVPVDDGDRALVGSLA